MTITVHRSARGLVSLFAVAIVSMGCSGVPNLDQGGMGCQNAGDGVQHEGSPTDPGQPLAGVDVVGRPAADVGRAAEAQGLIVRYHLDYATTNDGGGYGECWCTPPTPNASIGSCSASARKAACNYCKWPR